MKVWSSEHTFSHPWDTVVQAAVRKYPNPLSPYVTGVDVLDREVTQKGVLKSHRVLTTQWGLPNWVIKIVGMKEACYVSEHSWIDPKEKKMEMRSRNLTCCNYITVDEYLRYSQHPTDKKSTLLTQEAVIKINNMPLTNYLENLVVDTCAKNATKGRQAIEWVVGKIKGETEEISRAARKTAADIMSPTQATKL